MDVVFYVVFALAVVWVIYQAVRRGGVTGMLFGAAVRRQTAEVEAEGRGPYDVSLGVHVLDPDDARQGPHVGLMVSRSGVGSLRKTPVRLTRSQARRLAEELAQAAEASTG